MGALSYLPFIPRLVFKGGLPLHLTYFVTGRCNARCAHCFYRDSPNTEPEQELTLDEIDRFTSQLGPLLWLALTGGEPFLRHDMPQIVETFYRHVRPRHVTVSTNGLLTDRITADVDRMAASCPDSFFHINVSLDAPGAEHDELRGLQGSVPRILATAAAVRGIGQRRHNVGLGICTSYTATTEDRIWDMMELVERDLRPDHWDVSLVRDPARDPRTQQVDEQRFWQVKEVIERKLLRRSLGYYPTPSRALAVARIVFHNHVMRRIHGGGSSGYRCHAARLSVVLNEVGDLMACEKRDWKLGNIREADHDLDTIWRGPEARAIRGRIGQGCQCDHGCNLSVNLLFELSAYPRMWSVFGRRLLREILMS